LYHQKDLDKTNPTTPRKVISDDLSIPYLSGVFEIMVEITFQTSFIWQCMKVMFFLNKDILDIGTSKRSKNKIKTNLKKKN
jgi:hypothetical protein